MKRILLTILLMFSLSGIAFGQLYTNTTDAKVSVSKEITVTLLNTQTDAVYIGFPYPGKQPDFYMSLTALNTELPQPQMQPQGASGTFSGVFSGSGDAYLAIVPVTSGTEESDSLAVFIQPYFPMKSLGAWYAATPDTTFLIFDTDGEYATNVTYDWLNWTTNTGYGVSLSGELWDCGGFIIWFRQKAVAVGASTATITVRLTLEY